MSKKNCFRLLLKTLKKRLTYNAKHLTIFFGLLFFIPQAHAIPPPDFLVNVWQSLLQFFGIAAAFLLTAFFAVKDFLLARFTRKQLWFGFSVMILCIVGGTLGYLKYEKEKWEREVKTELEQNFQNPPPAESSGIQGELLSIDAVIARDKSAYSREWKRNLLMELFESLNEHRQQKNLPLIKIKTLSSFTPSNLAKFLQKEPESFILLDIRSDVEQASLSLPYETVDFSFAELANDETPSVSVENDDKKIIVICNTGVRGYLASLLLDQMGFENVAFIQGGLYEWRASDLPLKNNRPYRFIQDLYRDFNWKQVVASDTPKLDFTSHADFQNAGLSDYYPFYMDFKTPAEIISKIKTLGTQKPVILLCSTESQCFDAGVFAYEFTQAGGQILAYYEGEPPQKGSKKTASSDLDSASVQQVEADIWQKFMDINLKGTESSVHDYLNTDFGMNVSDFITAYEKGELTLIDLRERRARERGKIPESNYSRLRDFLAGEWKTFDLQKSDQIVLLCYTGARGSLAAEFLRQMGYDQVFYLEGGITKGILHLDFPFEGESTLGTPDNIQTLFSTKEVQNLVESGTVGLDVRPVEKFETHTVTGAQSLFLDGMTTPEVEKAIQSLDPEKTYFGICDSWLSCYSAKIIGFELERAGLGYVGRYAKPYEWEN